MASSTLSWAAIVRKDVDSATHDAPAVQVPMTTTSTLTASKPQLTKSSKQCRVAFVSGHVDITSEQFLANYAAALDAAIHRGDAFVLSNAGGTDTLALAYLHSHGVHPSRITIYLHTPRPNRRLDATQVRTNKARLGPDVERRYRQEGCNIKVIQGHHAERDAAMTEASDYDILWVRDEAETAALYGIKYRPGRISGTQKNKNRRLLKAARTGNPSSA